MQYPLPAADPLGTDLKLNTNGDLVITMSGSLDLVSKQDNVAQSVRVDITTLPTTYLWGKGVGSFLAQYVDQPMTSTMKNEIHNLILEKLRDNKRILHVQQVTFDDTTLKEGSIITIQAIAQGIGPVQIPISIGR